MSLERQAIRGFVWSGVENWGSQAGSLVVFVVLARLLTPDAFGVIALANVFVLLAGILTQQGFEHALFQRENLEPGHLDTAFLVHLGVGAALTGLAAGSAGWFASLFGTPELERVLRYLAPVILIRALGYVPAARLKRQLAFDRLAQSALVAITFSGIAGIGMAAGGLGVWSLVGQQIVYELVRLLVLWRATNWRPGLSTSRRHLRELLSFGVHIMGFQGVNLIAQRVAHVLVAAYLGGVALGYFAVAERVLQVMMQLLVTSVRSVAMPALSRMQTEPERMRAAHTKLLRQNALVAFPIFVGTAATAPELVSVLFGEQWAPAAPVLRILALAGIAWSMLAMMESVFVAMGRPGQRLVRALAGAALNLIAISVAIRWGLVAVAIAFLFSQVLLFPIVQRGADRLVGGSLRSTLECIAVPLACSVVMGGVVTALLQVLGNARPVWSLAASIALGAFTYALLIRAAAPVLFREFRQIASQAVVRGPRGPRSAPAARAAEDTADTAPGADDTRAS